MARFAAIFIGVAVLCLAAVATAGAQAPKPQPQPAGEGDPGASAPPLPDPNRLGDGGVGPASGDGKPDKGDDKPNKGDGKPGKGDGKPGKCRRGKGKGGCRNRGPLKLSRAEAKPSTAWFGGHPAVFRFAIDGRRKRNVVVQLKRKGGAIVRRWVVRDVKPRDDRTIAWDGRLAKKRYARQGVYRFKVRAKHGPAAIAKKASGRPRVGFFMNKFPIRGSHSYGDGLGAGRGHRGVDVFARCGTALQAARGGKVQHEAYQGSGAGHYLVIDARGTGKDYVYMHLQGASPLEPGDRVRTGQRIGQVGESGNAQGCHLHFELWGPPGWYQGGRVLDPVPPMRAWDRYS